MIVHLISGISPDNYNRSGFMGLPVS